MGAVNHCALAMALPSLVTYGGSGKWWDLEAQVPHHLAPTGVFPAPPSGANWCTRLTRWWPLTMALPSLVPYGGSGAPYGTNCCLCCFTIWHQLVCSLLHHLAPTGASRSSGPRSATEGFLHFALDISYLSFIIFLGQFSKETKTIRGEATGVAKIDDSWIL